MIAQYRFLALAGESCILRSSRQSIDEIRRAESEPKEGEERFISPVLQMAAQQRHCHVFIDDIEKAPVRTEFRAEMLFDLLDTMKRKQHGLTLTSNLSLASLTATLGDAAVARLDRICRSIET